MTDKRSFECVDCGSKVEQQADDPHSPECCGKPMKAESLQVCTATSTAEQSRSDDTGEPCDDGRAG